MYVHCSTKVMSCDSHVTVMPSHMIISSEMHDCSLVLAMMMWTTFPPICSSYYQGVDSGGECGVPHERRFPMPRPSLDEAW